MIRPGPDTIDAGQAPGGLVLRFYDVEHGDLIVEQQIAVPADSLRLAHQAQRQIDRLHRRRRAGPVVVVVYDGDTGHRWTADDYEACGYRPGDPLD